MSVQKFLYLILNNNTDTYCCICEYWISELCWQTKTEDLWTPPWGFLIQKSLLNSVVTLSWTHILGDQGVFPWLCPSETASKCRMAVSYSGDMVALTKCTPCAPRYCSPSGGHQMANIGVLSPGEYWQEHMAVSTMHRETQPFSHYHFYILRRFLEHIPPSSCPTFEDNIGDRLVTRLDQMAPFMTL